jgi:hypothetical protein
MRKKKEAIRSQKVSLPFPRKAYKDMEENWGKKGGKKR